MLAAERDDDSRPTLSVVTRRDDVDVDLGPAAPRIEPGEYPAVYVRSRYLRMFGRAEKLAIELDVLPDLDRSRRVRLSRWYNIRRQSGRVIVGPHSDLAREMRLVAGRRLRKGEFSPSAVLFGKLLRVEVRDVRVDRNQRDLGDANVYSVVARIIGVEVG